MNLKGSDDANRDQRPYWLALKSSPAVYGKADRLVRTFGSPRATWTQTRRALMRAGLEFDEVREFDSFRSGNDPVKLLAKAERQNIEIIIRGSSQYPGDFEVQAGYPQVIFKKGVFDLTNLKPAIALVGSRKATPYGLSIAHEIAACLAEAGVLIISGAARGIDSAAHRGALEADGQTIAVLGCGPDIRYPAENTGLFEEIAENGALITEFGLGIKPLKWHFPARNRLISSLSQAVVVVEAGQKSGALITVDFALEQGKDVLAVPGHVKSDLSKGCHSLIKQGACLIDSPDDVLDMLGITADGPAAGNSLTDEEKAVLEAMDWEPKLPYELSAKLAMSVPDLLGRLVILEVKGYLTKDASGRYLRRR